MSTVTSIVLAGTSVGLLWVIAHRLGAILDELKNRKGKP